MDNSREAAPVDLRRQELLGAIDYEISHRETAASRHGLTVWTIVAAVVALLWAAVNEIVDNIHIWPNVALVLFTGRWGLGLLTLLWTKSLYAALSVGFSPESGLGPKQFVLSKGGHPDLLPYYILEALVMLCLSIYLGIKGFILLSVLASFGQVLVLLFLLVAWVILHVCLPLKLKPSAGTEQQTKHAIYVKTGVYLLLGLALLAVAWSLVPVCHTLGRADIRLGLLLAALLTLFSVSLRLTSVPLGVDQLRSVRSKLAFG